MAKATKAKRTDDPKFDEIKARVADMRQCHYEAMSKGLFIRIPAKDIIEEMEYLIGKAEGKKPVKAEVAEDELVEV